MSIACNKYNARGARLRCRSTALGDFYVSLLTARQKSLKYLEL